MVSFVLGLYKIQLKDNNEFRFFLRKNICFERQNQDTRAVQNQKRTSR